MARSFIGLALIVVVGCGVPLQAEPEAIDPSLLPEAPIEVQAPSEGGGFIYLVSDDGLVAVGRGTTSEPSEALDQLLAGPTTDEERSGLRTAIPIDSSILDISVTEGQATVDLSAEFGNVGGQEEILAIGQLVLTLTAIGIEQVMVNLEGLPVALPLPNGVLVADPVGVADYHSLIAR